MLAEVTLEAKMGNFLQGLDQAGLDQAFLGDQIYMRKNWRYTLNTILNQPKNYRRLIKKYTTGLLPVSRPVEHVHYF